MPRKPTPRPLDDHRLPSGTRRPSTPRIPAAGFALAVTLTLGVGLSGCSYQEAAILAAISYQTQHHPHLDTTITATPTSAHVGESVHLVIDITNPSTYFHLKFTISANAADATRLELNPRWTFSSQEELAAGATRRVEMDVPIGDARTTQIGVLVPEDSGRERTFAKYPDDERLHWVPIAVVSDG